MEFTLSIVQIVLSIVLIGLILLQQRGTGLAAVFGGESAAYHTKRGLEKIIFIATIVTAILFVAVAVTTLFLSNA